MILASPEAVKTFPQGPVEEKGMFRDPSNVYASGTFKQLD